MSAEAIVNLLAREVLNPIMALLFAVGLLLFVYGLVEFLWSLSKGSHKAANGKKHMFWGLAGMFIMSSAFAIVRLIASIVGKQLPY